MLERDPQGVFDSERALEAGKMIEEAIARHMVPRDLAQDLFDAVQNHEARDGFDHHDVAALERGRAAGFTSKRTAA